MAKHGKSGAVEIEWRRRRRANWRAKNKRKAERREKARVGAVETARVALLLIVERGPPADLPAAQRAFAAAEDEVDRVRALQSARRAV